MKTEFVASIQTHFCASYPSGFHSQKKKRNKIFKLEVDKYPAMIDKTFYQDQLKSGNNALMLNIFKILLMCLLININIILMEAHLIEIKKNSIYRLRF